jgi:hypothetical protein
MAKNKRRQGEDLEEFENDNEGEFDMSFVIIPLVIFLVMGFFTI